MRAKLIAAAVGGAVLLGALPAYALAYQPPCTANNDSCRQRRIEALESKASELEARIAALEASPSPSPTPTSSPSPSASPTPTPTTPTPTPTTVQVALRAPDGGADPYSGRLPVGVPVGVWFESVLESFDTATDKAAGLNLYVELTGNTSISLIRDAGMYAIHGNESWNGAETAGWLLGDELDMRAGPGWDAWNGSWGWPMCTPDNAQCGYTITKTVADGLPKDRWTYANYGKGVAFWETDAEAKVFVNGGTPPGGTFTPFQHVVSADIYWYTDNDSCTQWQGGALLLGGSRALTTAECRRASNYGATVNKVRRLVEPTGSKPVWNFVEVGGPFAENTSVASFIQPREVDAAVWHSLIAGARGIVYFNHTFGLASCQSQHILREPSRTACGYDKIRTQVTATNGKVQQAAKAVNGQFADFNGAAAGDVTTTGQVVGSTRWDGANFWLLAGHSGGRGAAATVGTFNLGCVGNATATVVGENRSVPVANGVLTDDFADALTTHVYRIDGGSTCGLGG